MALYEAFAVIAEGFAKLALAKFGFIRKGCRVMGSQASMCRCDNRAAERRRPVKVTKFERRELAAARKELDQE